MDDLSFEALIELLRQKEQEVREEDTRRGRREIPLPSAGRMKFPKRTIESTLYWVGDDDVRPDVVVGDE